MRRGFFGIGVYRPKTEMNIGTLWRSAHLLGAAYLFTVGARYRRQPTDTTGAAKHVPLFAYEDMDDLLAHMTCDVDAPLIGIEMHERSRPLPEFTHPKAGVYLLGSEDRGLPSEVVARCHRLLEVPTLGYGSLNVATAGSIVLYDRFTRLGGN